MATSDAAMAFAQAFREATAATLGVSPDSIVLNGISTDGDTEPGCAGGDDSGVTTGTTIQVTDEFAANLHPTAFDDCYLTAEEMSTSDAAMAFAQAFRETTAAALGVSPDSIVLNGISTDGDDEPGCAGGDDSGFTSGTTIHVDPEYAANLHPTAFDDCWLTAEEM